MAFEFLKRKPEIKAVPHGVAVSDTATRGAISKAFRPYWLYKPPFGVPRNKDLDSMRRLGQAPHAFAAKQTIIDQIDSIQWDIQPKEGFTEEDAVTKAHIQEVKAFFENPNTLKENWNNIQRQVINDILDLNSGVIVKEFNEQGEMVEMRAIDGATFLKNPNRYGKYDDRAPYIPIKLFGTSDLDWLAKQGMSEQGKVDTGTESALTNVQAVRPGMSQDFLTRIAAMDRDKTNFLTVQQASQLAAYFQFGWGTGAAPIPFGTKEVVWIERTPTTYDLYGKSPIEICMSVLQTLVWSIDYYREFFENNNVPKGFFLFEGATDDDIKNFMDRLNEGMRVRDSAGMIRKLFHRIPGINAKNGKFEKIELNPAELDMIANTTLFQKIFWACMGVTPSEMGYTEDSNKATESEQGKKFKKKAILPLINTIEYYVNREIIGEFEFDDVEFKYNTFDTEDEIKKWQLYDIQTRVGIPVNEIRQKEGLPPIEGGDQLKGVMSAGEYNAGPKEFQKPEDTGKVKEEKGIPIDEADLNKAIYELLEKAEGEIYELIRKEGRQSRLSQIHTKSLPDILKRLDELFSLDAIKELLKGIIRYRFVVGNEMVEKQLDQNLPINHEQVKFISEYTFQNIKGMEDDLKNNLRQILERGIMNGERISTLTEKVKEAFQSTKARAETIARTEIARAENLGQLNAMKNSGTKVKKFVSVTLDHRTSDICHHEHERYGGEKDAIDLDQPFKVMVDGKIIEAQAPPFHPNCRSAIVFTSRGI